MGIYAGIKFYVIVLVVSLLGFSGLHAFNLQTNDGRKALRQQVTTDINAGNWTDAASGIQRFDSANLPRFAIDLRQEFANAYTKEGTVPASWPSVVKQTGRQQAKKLIEQALEDKDFELALAGIKKMPEKIRRDLYKNFVTAAVKAEEIKPVPAPSPAPEMPSEPAPEMPSEPAPEVPSGQSNKAQLLDAALDGNLDLVKSLISAGVDVDATDTDGDTALIVASSEGHTDIVRALINAKATIDATDADGYTALITASMKGYTDIVKALINARANVNAAATDGDTALIVASSEGHTEIVRALINAGANVNAAASNGDTALIAASSDDRIGAARVLLGAGADLSLKNNKGKTALDYAKQERYEEMTALLTNEEEEQQPSFFWPEDNFLGRPKDLQAFVGKLQLLTDKNNSLLHAAERGQLEAVKLILKAGATVDAANDDDSTALLLASKMGHKNIVTYLLDQGADKDAQDDSGDTPLIVASENNYPDIVKVLLDAGADKDIADADKKVALDYAREEGYEEIVNLLTDEGGDQQEVEGAMQAGEQAQSDLLKKIGAEELVSFDSTGEGPIVIKIRVPQQVSAECGLRAIANLSAVRDQLNKEQYEKKFLTQSERAYSTIFKTCPREGVNWIQDNLIAKYANQAGLANIVILVEPNIPGGKRTIYPVLGRESLNELIEGLNKGQREMVNVIIRSFYSFNITDRSIDTRQHWTAASIVKTSDMKEPVILFMDSLDNSNVIPPRVRPSLEYLANQLSKKPKAQIAEYQPDIVEFLGTLIFNNDTEVITGVLNSLESNQRNVQVNGYTLLSLAVIRRSPEMIKQLLKYDEYAKDKSNALMLAKQREKELENKKNKNKQENQDLDRYKEIVRLLSPQVSEDEEDEEYPYEGGANTPLNRLVDAISRNDIDTVNTILQNEKIDVNALGKDKNSLLVVALVNNGPEIIDLLVKKGARPFFSGSKNHQFNNFLTHSSLLHSSKEVIASVLQWFKNRPITDEEKELFLSMLKIPSLKKNLDKIRQVIKEGEIFQDKGFDDLKDLITLVYLFRRLPGLNQNLKNLEELRKNKKYYAVFINKRRELFGPMSDNEIEKYQKRYGIDLKRSKNFAEEVGGLE